MKDPFGSEDELRGAIDRIPTETSVVMVGNAGHDLLRGNFNIGEQVVTPFFKLMNREIEPE
ncbi:MAG: hypothetical protein M3Y72_19800 [Acidobacteriota bacterium]|nr:hypothetical protein [Acidobacteriota bacterium]